MTAPFLPQPTSEPNLCHYHSSENVLGEDASGFLIAVSPPRPTHNPHHLTAAFPAFSSSACSWSVSLPLSLSESILSHHSKPFYITVTPLAVRLSSHLQISYSTRPQHLKLTPTSEVHILHIPPYSFSRMDVTTNPVISVSIWVCQWNPLSLGLYLSTRNDSPH